MEAQPTEKGDAALTNDDALFRYRLRLMALAKELGNVRAACRAFGIHDSTYYRWRAQMIRHGTTETLRPRERPAPRMPNATPVVVEGRVLAYALTDPGHGPNRISAELAREKWGGIGISPNGAWRVLRRHGLSTRAARLGLVAGYAAPPEPERQDPQPERHLEVERPGQLVQMDCFCIGRSRGPRARCGSTRPSTWSLPTPGPSCTPRPATPWPAGPRPWPAVWPRIWRRGLVARGRDQRQRF